MFTSEERIKFQQVLLVNFTTSHYDALAILCNTFPKHNEIVRGGSRGMNTDKVIRTLINTSAPLS